MCYGSHWQIYSGNNLYVYLPHFCNPQYFYDYDLVSYLEEFYFIKSFNIPLIRKTYKRKL